jgi:hypothetical protein
MDGSLIQQMAIKMKLATTAQTFQVDEKKLSRRPSLRKWDNRLFPPDAGSFRHLAQRLGIVHEDGLPHLSFR